MGKDILPRTYTCTCPGTWYLPFIMLSSSKPRRKAHQDLVIRALRGMVQMGKRVSGVGAT